MSPFDGLEELGPCPIEGRHGTYINKAGELVVYFQSNCSEEAIVARMLLTQQPECMDPYEEERLFEESLRQTMAVDARLEKRGVKMVNLGMRANRISSRSRLSYRKLREHEL